MAKPRNARKTSGARVFQFSPRGDRSIDVRKLLLETQSAPTVAQPADVTAAIERRARELGEEAYLLCREHLRRRVAYECETGWPRVLYVEKAHRVINEGNLGDALVREFSKKLRDIGRTARMAAQEAATFEQEIETALEAHRES